VTGRIGGVEGRGMGIGWLGCRNDMLGFPNETGGATKVGSLEYNICLHDAGGKAGRDDGARHSEVNQEVERLRGIVQSNLNPLEGVD